MILCSLMSLKYNISSIPFKFDFRIGDFYPPLKTDFNQTRDCPIFWRDKKIKINLLNMANEDYIDNIQLLAYVGLGINILVSIACFVLIWRFSRISTAYKQENGPLFEICGRKILPGYAKIKFAFFKIILVFVWPLVDSVLGMYYSPYRRTKLNHNNNKSKLAFSS